MFKIILYLIVFALVIIGATSLYHLYQVKEKNKIEMASFQKNIPLDTNLGKVLVVYYSLTGHTKDIALRIAQKTQADIYEIKTQKVYTSPSVYIESKKELLSQKYPTLKKGFLPNMADYDTVFVGAPVWWYTMAPALYSFLEKADFKKTRVAAFSTQGSNYGTFFEDFASKIKNATLLAHEDFNNMSKKYDNEISNKINAWLNKLSR